MCKEKGGWCSFLLFDVTAITARVRWDVQPSLLVVSDSQECFSLFGLRAGGISVLLRVLLVLSRAFRDLSI